MTVRYAIAVIIVALYPGTGHAQATETNTNCTAVENSLNCTSTSTATPPPSGGALAGVNKAIASSRSNSSTDWSALQKWKDEKNERRFEEDTNGIEQIRLNYTAHQQSGEVFPKETIKAFNTYRRDACKVQKWLPNPVSLASMLRDLDGTPRSCREVVKIK